jgi:hypothetical protein
MNIHRSITIKITKINRGDFLKTEDVISSDVHNTASNRLLFNNLISKPYNKIKEQLWQHLLSTQSLPSKSTVVK